MTTSAGGGVGEVVSYKAAHDLSSNQYRFVRVTAANTVGSTDISGTTTCVILQNKPGAANSPADCMLTGGLSKLLMAGTCSAGGKIISDSDGKGVISDTGTTNFCNAIADEAASAAADIISVRTVGFYNNSGAA